MSRNKKAKFSPEQIAQLVPNAVQNAKSRRAQTLSQVELESVTGGIAAPVSVIAGAKIIKTQIDGMITPFPQEKLLF